MSRKAGEKDDLEHAEPARRMRDLGDRERDEEDAEHDEIAGIAGFGQGEIDDRGRRQKLDRPDQQLPRDDRQRADNGPGKLPIFSGLRCSQLPKT